MKRLVYMMMALVVLFAANSCKDKKTAQVITPTDSLDLEEVADDSTIYGVCGEGTSMHNLELISDEGDTLSVFIDDEQPDIVLGGLLAGDRIALIGYKAQDGEMMAQKIINLTSLLGKWTSLDKGWQGIRHTAQNALVAIFLLLLDLLPGFLYRSSILGFAGTKSQGFFRIGSFCLPGFCFFRLLIYHLSRIIDIHIRIRHSPVALFLPVDERMAEHQFVSFLIADIADIELAVFSADDAIEHHVLQHIAQLLLDILVIALHQGITKFESLLDGIRTKTLECLFLIPWTLQAQTILYIQQAAERH
jgi:hypothetical protein